MYGMNVPGDAPGFMPRAITKHFFLAGNFDREQGLEHKTIVTFKWFLYGMVEEFCNYRVAVPCLKVAHGFCTRFQKIIVFSPDVPLCMYFLPTSSLLYTIRLIRI